MKLWKNTSKKLTRTSYQVYIFHIDCGHLSTLFHTVCIVEKIFPLKSYFLLDEHHQIHFTYELKIDEHTLNKSK